MQLSTKYCLLVLTFEFHLHCLNCIVVQIGVGLEYGFPHLHPPVFVAFSGVNAGVLNDESAHGAFVKTAVLEVIVSVVKLPIGEHVFLNTRFDKGNVAVCLNFRHAHVNDKSWLPAVVSLSLLHQLLLGGSVDCWDQKLLCCWLPPIVFLF